jgi:hypothetical protein
VFFFLNHKQKTLQKQKQNKRKKSEKGGKKTRKIWWKEGK